MKVSTVSKRVVHRSPKFGGFAISVLLSITMLPFLVSCVGPIIASDDADVNLPSGAATGDDQIKCGDGGWR